MGSPILTSHGTYKQIVHILFLSDNFPPETNAPANRTHEHCREWVKAGHKVTVITCAPNFPKGELLNGYKNKIWQSEIIDGIHVWRVWSYISANKGFASRIIDYISYMISAVIAAIFVRRADIVIGTSPQLFTACAAYLVGLYKQIPYIFELRDLWPESIKAVGAMKNSKFIDLLEKLELFLYRKATKIVSVTNSFKENLISRGIDASKIHVVTNGVDISKFRPQEKNHELVNKFNLNGKFIAGYVGTIGMAHSIDTLLFAAQELSKLSNPDRYKILILGEGANKEKLKKLALEMNLNNLIFIDSVPRDQVRDYWSLLDVSIIHLKKTDLFKTVIPSKLFECMAMGIPILHGVEGESSEIVKNEDVGITFEPENFKALTSEIQRLESNPDLYQRYKLNGIKSAKNFSRDALALKMLEVIECS